jgi:ribosome-associated translation inhibitor RaiA
VQRRLGLALARFGDLVDTVAVRFTRTDTGSRCEIEVRLRPRSLRAEDTDADLIAALDRAGGRIARSVSRAVEREHAWADIR